MNKDEIITVKIKQKKQDLSKLRGLYQFKKSTKEIIKDIKEG